MAVTRTFCLAAGLAVVLPGSLISQTRVRGVVVDSGTGAPLESARIVGPRGITYSDGFGRFVVAIDSFPSRIVIVRIGSRATSVIVAQAPDTLLRIPLAAVPVRIADLVVEGTTDHDATDLGRWTVPLDRGTLLPMVQPDVLRALAASPAVTQSTIVSARPLVRGYDPGEATLLLDGFELPNPYHLARAFSAIPAVGVERVTVATAPTAITIGGTSGAAVELTGRTGPTGSPTGGVAVDPVSLTGWLGGAPGGVRLFGAGRAVTLGALATLAGKRFAYGFNDGYASVIVDRGGAPWLRTTLFGSHDRVEDQGGGDAMSWGVAMLGTRVDLWRRGGAGIALSGYATRFDERIDRLALRSSLVDVDNDYSRVGGALEWRASAGARRLQVGFAPSWRRIRNRVSVLGGSLFPAALDDGRPEYAGYGSWSERVGRVEVELGVRFDGSAGAGAWQPRARGDWDLGKGWSVGVAAGRSARLYQTVSDPNGEPELVFYDLWFVAGRGGIPVSRVDHAFLSTSWRHAGFSFRAGAYVSRGAGIV
ncbi:MAG TPA: TonB-dependent receptor plug domain-containing protein, partial [Gemmatimonadales bacterium]|nr:TonB-dependent receptor plug domain-containing protein [Gemmatimonadales bacterium]